MHRECGRLVWAGGCAALALGMAGAADAVSAPAQARVTAILVTSHVAASWGYNAQGQLGNGTTTDPAGPVQVTGLANATQVAAGGQFSLAVHTVLGLVGSQPRGAGPAA